ncbi:MAG: rane protein [Subtercola sp.]|nr:rane protein [Subtercola sp.]
MIPVPQPRSAPGASGQLPGPALQPPTPGGSRPPRGRRALIITVVAAAVLAGAALGISLLLGRGIDFVLIGLIAAFLVFGGLGVVLRFLPSTLPFLSFASRTVGFLALAALAGLLYLYVYPAVTNSTGAGGGFTPPGPSVSLTRQATVVYTVTGDGSAEITAMSPLPNGDIAQQTVGALPYEHSVQLTINRRTPGLFTMVAGNPAGGDDSQLACTITVDGVVVAHQEASGAHSTVFCSGTPQ